MTRARACDLFLQNVHNRLQDCAIQSTNCLLVAVRVPPACSLRFKSFSGCSPSFNFSRRNQNGLPRDMVGHRLELTCAHVQSTVAMLKSAMCTYVQPAFEACHYATNCAILNAG